MILKISVFTRSTGRMIINDAILCIAHAFWPATVEFLFYQHICFRPRLMCAAVALPTEFALWSLETIRGNASACTALNRIWKYVWFLSKRCYLRDAKFAKMFMPKGILTRYLDFCLFILAFFLASCFCYCFRVCLCVCVRKSRFPVEFCTY